MNSSLSRKIVIAALVGFVMALVGLAGQISPFVVLDPTLFLRGELWRLISYPLALGFLDLVITTIAFSAPGDELEGMMGTRQFSLTILLVVVAAGMTHVALHVDQSTSMSGMSNVALFVLIGFVYLFPHSSLRIFFFSVRSWIALSVVAGIEVIQVWVTVSRGGPPTIIFTYGGFGVMAGLLYFHVRYQKYAFLLRPIRVVERALTRFRTPSSKPVRADVGRVAPGHGAFRLPFGRSEHEPLSDQERLDQILDIITERGYDSLSQDDRLFLDEYSKGMP